MRNRDSFHFSATALNHQTDLNEIISSNFRDKFDLLVISDGGIDVDHENLRVQLMLGEVWLRNKLGTLSHVFHAPGESYRNFIERLFHLLNIVDGNFSFLTDPPCKLTVFFAGVNFSGTLAGETHAPSEQSDLTPDQVAKKTRTIVNFAFDFLDKTWSDLETMGHKINCKRVFPEVLLCQLFFGFIPDSRLGFRGAINRRRPRQDL
jgi:hypothetical protein